MRPGSWLQNRSRIINIIDFSQYNSLTTVPAVRNLPDHFLCATLETILQWWGHITPIQCLGCNGTKDMRVNVSLARLVNCTILIQYTHPLMVNFMVQLTFCTTVNSLMCTIEVYMLIWHCSWCDPPWSPLVEVHILISFAKVFQCRLRD